MRGERVHNLRIRDVTEADAEQIAKIYAHHVLTGTASYDIDAPTADFHRDKIRRILAAGWPFIVAEQREEVAGYAYATQFRDRAAYRFTCEDSIYVHPQRLGQGIGKALLAELLKRAAQCGFRVVIAVIGGAEPASVALHRNFGFVEAGRLKQVGFKFEQWLDSVYMQRELTRPK